MRIPVPGITAGFVLVCLAVDIVGTVAVLALPLSLERAFEIRVDAQAGDFEIAVTNSVTTTLSILDVLCAAAFTTRRRGFGRLVAAAGVGRLSLALTAWLQIAAWGMIAFFAAVVWMIRGPFTADDPIAEVIAPSEIIPLLMISTATDTLLVWTILGLSLAHPPWCLPSGKAPPRA